MARYEITQYTRRIAHIVLEIFSLYTFLEIVLFEHTRAVLNREKYKLQFQFYRIKIKSARGNRRDSRLKIPL